MSDVNWWLMALAFVLGLLATFAFTVRRVQREVPRFAADGRRAAVDPGAVRHPSGREDVSETVATGPIPVADTETQEIKTAQRPTGAGKHGIAGAAGAAAGAAGAAGLAAGAGRTTSGEDARGDDAKTTAFRPPAQDTIEVRPVTRPVDSREHTGEGASTPSDAETRAFASHATPPGSPESVAGPYGVGSAKAGAGGSGPDSWTIKGSEDSMVWHGPDSPKYSHTVAEVWFTDEDTAEQAGFTSWRSDRTD